MEKQKVKVIFSPMIRILLSPFSLLFGIITFVRNKLYDWKMIPSVQYDDIFVISVGNITVGGTGKTPFVEYLIRLLSQNYRVAVLSHGYKRATKGFMFVNANVSPDEAGDESYQIKRKFPDTVVAVDNDKLNGIAQIRKTHPNTQILLLDDAFQYRRIKPNLSVLLADYNRPMYRDCMLPSGRLREWACFSKRADFMIITKTSVAITPDEQQDIKQQYARIFPKEPFFTTIGYGEPLPVFLNNKPLTINDFKRFEVLLVTGIANPKPFEAYARQHAASLQTITFPDHHAFSEKDISRITAKWNAIPSAEKILLTTEKDAVRLQQIKILDEITKQTYYVPVGVIFMGDDKKHFEQKLKIIVEKLKKIV
jgi:tetraacyldisaccharide 4'-kinase